VSHAPESENQVRNSLEIFVVWASARIQQN
jgi:hypothetical protein